MALTLLITGIYRNELKYNDQDIGSPGGAHDEYFLLLDGVRAHEPIGEGAESTCDEDAVNEAKNYSPRSEGDMPRLHRAIRSEIPKRDPEKEEDDGIAGSRQRLGEVLDGVIGLFGDVMTNVMPLNHSTGYDTQDTFERKILYACG